MSHLPGTDESGLHPSRHALVRACARLADAPAFNIAVFAVIIANAVTLGLQTYERLYADHGALLDALDRACLAVFVVELAIRFVAVGASPRRFLRSGWNVFDLVVVGAALAPGLGEHTTILRLLRLARVARVVRLLPDLRVLTLAIARAVPASRSLVVMALLVLFVYGMIGWSAFGEDHPDEYGDIGSAMLTLFVTLTLANFPDQLELGRATSRWGTLYFVSFALVASFLLLNILIGIVINSMEEARALEAARLRRAGRERALERGEGPDAAADGGDGAALAQRIGELRRALDELEAAVRARPG